jgi:hypothetical protein
MDMEGKLDREFLEYFFTQQRGISANSGNFSSKQGKQTTTTTRRRRSRSRIETEETELKIFFRKHVCGLWPLLPLPMVVMELLSVLMPARHFLIRRALLRIPPPPAPPPLFPTPRPLLGRVEPSPHSRSSTFASSPPPPPPPSSAGFRASMASQHHNNAHNHTGTKMIGKSARLPGAVSKAHAYCDVNLLRPREYWDYESIDVQWG